MISGKPPVRKCGMATESSGRLLSGGERGPIDLLQGARERLIDAPNVGRVMREALRVPGLKT